MEKYFTIVNWTVHIDANIKYSVAILIQMRVTKIQKQILIWIKIYSTYYTTFRKNFPSTGGTKHTASPWFNEVASEISTCPPQRFPYDIFLWECALTLWMYASVLYRWLGHTLMSNEWLLCVRQFSDLPGSTMGSQNYKMNPLPHMLFISGFSFLIKIPSVM